MEKSWKMAKKWTITIDSKNIFLNNIKKLSKKSC